MCNFLKEFFQMMMVTYFSDNKCMKKETWKTLEQYFKDN